MNFKLLSLLWLSCLIQGVYAQEQITLSLAEAQAYGVANSYSVQLSDLDIELARKKVKETAAIGLPQINASGSYQNFLDIPVMVIPDFISPTVVGTLIQTGVIEPSEAPEGTGGLVSAQFGTKFNVTGGITASQLLFDGSYIVGLQAAKAYVEFASLNKERSEAEVREQVAQVYFTVIVAEENLKVLEQSLQTTESLLSETTALYENGFLEEQDVDQLKLQRNALSNQLDYAKMQLAVAYDLLKFNLAIPAETTLVLSDDVKSLVEDGEHEGILATPYSVALDPDYKVLDANVALLQLNERREKAAYLPQLSASFTHQQQAMRNEFNVFDSGENWFPSTILGLSLSIPIWSSGLRSARIQQAQLEVEKVMLNRDQLTEAAQLEYRMAYADMLNAINQYNTSRESLDLAERIQTRTGIKYKEGLAGSLDLTQAQNQFLSAQGNYISSMLQLLNAKVRLKKSLNQF